jgi:hypothetical protein
MRYGFSVALACALILAAAPAAGAQSVRGDFDGDGHPDLAIGVPEESVQGHSGAGAVNILNGADSGLSSYGDEHFTTATLGIGTEPVQGAHLGAALAAGDLNHDGFADLAVGAPGDDPGGATSQPRSGVVLVYYGSGSGLRPRNAETLYSQNSAGVVDTAEAGDRFGAALAIGDFDGDDYADLAIGAPGEDLDGQVDAGVAHVFRGRPSSLGTAGSQFFSQDTPGLKGVARANHRFGAALSASDVSRNGRADLAIGIPGATIDGQSEAGAALVLYGRSSGLSATDDLWSQGSRGIKGAVAANERFGHAVTIGDFDDDGAGDLAVGVPNDLGSGSVNVLYGSATGLRADDDQRWSQDARGIKSRASTGEQFGSALAAGDFSSNGVDDLAIGVPGEQISGRAEAGSVTVLYGNRHSGLDDRADQRWMQDAPGVKGASEAAERFGESLSAGDFDDDGSFDLAVGVPADRVGGVPDAGGVVSLFGTSSGLRAAGDELWTQGSPGVKGAVANDGFGSTLASQGVALTAQRHAICQGGSWPPPQDSATASARS